MARENAMMEATINVAEETVTFRRTKTGETLTIRAKDAHPDMRQYAMLHGFKQRGADNGAIERKTTDGRIRTAAEQEALRWGNVKVMVEHINSGTSRWNLREPGKGGGAKKPVFDLDLVVRAAMALTGKDYAAIRAHIERRAKTANCTMAAIAEAWVGQDARLGAKVAELRAAQADPSLSEGLLDELLDNDGEE